MIIINHNIIGRINSGKTEVEFFEYRETIGDKEEFIHVQIINFGTSERCQIFHLFRQCSQPSFKNIVGLGDIE
jgi:hypothetical protein